MRYFYQRPIPPLASYVRTMFVLDGAAEPVVQDGPIFTQGVPVLLCRIDSTEAGNIAVKVWISSKSLPDVFWQHGERTRLIACFFTPFSLPCLLRMPASKLLGEPVELSDWNGQLAKRLRDGLLTPAGIAIQVSAIENFLCEQLEINRQTCELIQRATDGLMINSGAEALAEMLKTLNISERTFQRLFKKYVGVTPGRYRRICQFQQSFDDVRNKSFESLSEVAYENGFADQSHFIRSFKEFTETTPHDYLQSGLKKKK